MTIRFLYMKFLGLLLVITGFSYSLTSFYNFFDVIFGGKIIEQSNSLLLMSVGLLLPLFVFVFGVYFYFYSDQNITKVNPFIVTSSTLLIVIGSVKLLFSSYYIDRYLGFITQIFDFIHISCGYVLIVLGLFLIYGCVKYKY